MARLKSVVPTSDEDVMALPVKTIDRAAAFYTGTLGFSIVSQESDSAVLKRDDAEIGLVRQPDHQPGKAGSIAFEVDDIDAMHSELQALGGKPGELDTEDWDGKQYRTFFLVEQENGYCYCFYQPA